MNRKTVGLWDVVDLGLRGVGKGVAWVAMRKAGGEAEQEGYALLGGAVLFTVFGGLVGFGLANHTRDLFMAEGAIIGGLLGACSGVFFGSFVEAIDGTINHVLRSLDPK